MTARDLPTGIRKRTGGYQAYVWVVDPSHPKGGYQASQQFDPNTSLLEMREWRNKRRLNLAETIPVTTFADDAREYLTREKVLKMPTAGERARHIEEWMRVFGKRPRAEIQPQQIQHALDQMRGRLAPGSINKRRTALMDLWTTLDGRHQANPVKATRPYEEPHPEPRAPELAVVLKLLRALPTKTDFARKCKARCSVIAWTGWPHAIVKQLEPGDIDWTQKTAFVHRRRKGKGARARVLPLLPEAIRALRAFKAADAWGPFSNSSLHKRVTETCRRKQMPRIRPYDLRHFFGTLIATITRDERAVQELMLLSTVKQARRYTEAATDPRVQAAVAEVADALPGLRKAAGRIGRVSRPAGSVSVPERPSRQRKTLRKSRKR